MTRKAHLERKPPPSRAFFRENNSFKSSITLFDYVVLVDCITKNPYDSKRGFGCDSHTSNPLSHQRFLKLDENISL